MSWLKDTSKLVRQAFINHTIGFIVYSIGGLITAGLVVAFFKKIVFYLSIYRELALLILLVVLCALFGYSLGRREKTEKKKKQFKPFYIDFDGFDWRIEAFKYDEAQIEDYPYCSRCRVRCNAIPMGGYEYTIICPACNGTRGRISLVELRKGAKNIATAKLRGEFKTPLKR